MIRNYCKHPAFLLQHRFRSIFLASSMMLLTVLFVQISSIRVQADGGVPGGNIADPVVRAVDIAKPAVVRIFTTLNGRITVHFTATQSATFPLNGGNYKLQFSGSGAFVTSHGDILTATHVINPPHDSELDNALYQVAAQDIADYINQNLNATTTYTAQDALASMIDGNFTTDTHYGQPSSDVYLDTDYSGPSSQTDLKKLGADVHLHVTKIEGSSPSNEHDTALIHVNMSDTPSIQLGDSSGVAQLDELTIIGFPGNADVTTKQDPTQLLTSSINKIYVSALKQNDSGSSLIQVGGNVEHGDSGGPAIDSNGNIIGIVSFYSSEADTPLGTSFLQASSYAQTLIVTQGLNTNPGAFEKAWRQAFDDYASTTPGHWHKAQQELQKLALDYNNFNAITPYLNYAQGQASHEKLPRPRASSSTNYVAWAIALSILLLVVIVLGCLLLLGARRGKKSATPTTPGTQSTSSLQAAPLSKTTQPFPEWQSQQPHADQRISSPLQQMHSGYSWPQQSPTVGAELASARFPTYTPQQEFSELSPGPTLWEQNSPVVPVSPTPQIFEKWQYPPSVTAEEDKNDGP